MSDANNKIWIELAQPTCRDHAEMQCALATNMLLRLGVEDANFFVDHKGHYCFGGTYGYKELTDRGEWFNLDYFGRVI